jgi:DNA-3-methyladenine glycosylase II
MSRHTLEPRGPFSLAAAARFIAGWPPASDRGSAEQGVRLAFLVDDWSGPAEVILRQDGDGVHAEVAADNAERALAQAARIVSLDHDGAGYAAVGERDAVVGEAQRATGYLRPVLFHSPYEAACWSIISARVSAAQGAREPLLAAEPDDALAALRELPGIGPFYAALILLRAVGTTDVLAANEPRLRARVTERYGAELEAVADGWRPFRTWVSVLLRAAG